MIYILQVYFHTKITEKLIFVSIHFFEKKFLTVMRLIIGSNSFFSKLTVFKLPPPLPPIIRNDKGLTLQLCCEAIWNDCSLFQ